MSGKPEPREIIISDEKLFPDVQSLADREERQSAGGFILRATRNGKIVEYSATDASGVPLPGRYLRMADGAPHGAAPDVLLLRGSRRYAILHRSPLS